MELAKQIGWCFMASALSFPTAALSQTDRSGPALGGEIFLSSDSDGTDVLRAAVDFDIRNAGEEKRLGVRVEHASYRLPGLPEERRERVFLRIADDAYDWNVSATIGTDGDTIIGAASVHDNSRYRKEFFVDRDIVETPLGLGRGIYSTFAGGAIDIPADDRNTFTALVGLQEFTGKNVRFHLRGNYVHVIDASIGLSAQLRGRYFRSSDPGEFDYYSPRYYAQVLPVAQIRRFVGGWQLLAAGGIGLQRDSSSNWRQANFAQLKVSSPSTRAWGLSGEAVFTQTPANSAVIGEGYNYFQSRISIYHRF